MAEYRRYILKILSVAGVAGVTGCSSKLPTDITDMGSTDGESTEPEDSLDMELVAELVGDDAGDNARFGAAVALSGDATTAVVSAYDQNNASDPGRYDRTGAVYIFANSGGSWSQQKQFRPDGPDSAMGGEVAVSGDGTTAMIEMSGENGAAKVFERSDGSWSRQTQLTPPNGAVRSRFANSMALSTDGTVAVIGDSATEIETESGPKTGAAYVYERADGSWTHRTTLHGPADDMFGRAVALSTDETTAVVGSYQSVSIFTRSGDSWSQETSLTTASQHDIASVAVSADGSTIAAGTTIFASDGEVDPTYVFDRSDGSWSQRAMLVPDQADATMRRITTVDVADDGDTVAVSAGGGKRSDSSWDNPEREPDLPGAAYVFTRGDDSWTYQGSVLGNEYGRGFGHSMALGSTAETLAVTDRTQRTDDGNSGAVFVYENL